eukprot:1259-Heterococcus_DN1.PRE.3
MELGANASVNVDGGGLGIVMKWADDNDYVQAKSVDVGRESRFDLSGSKGAVVTAGLDGLNLDALYRVDLHVPAGHVLKISGQPSNHLRAAVEAVQASLASATGKRLQLERRYSSTTHQQ